MSLGRPWRSIDPAAVLAGHSASKTRVNALVPGHPRLFFSAGIASKAWMPGARPDMTSRRRHSPRLGTGGLDHPRPFRRVFGDDFPERGGGAADHRRAEIGKAGLDLRIGERRVDLLVKHFDDLGGRVLRRTQAVPGAGLVARQEIAER